MMAMKRMVASRNPEGATASNFRLVDNGNGSVTLSWTTSGASAKQSRMAHLVDAILASKSRAPSSETSPLEFQIDALAFHLYGLTEDEIAIIGTLNNQTKRV